MMIVEGSYLLWFAKFGSLTFEQMDSVEDAIDLVVRLRDQSTSMAEYDAHGSPDALEKVGDGIVEDFFDLCDEREVQVERENDEWRKGQERKRAENPGPRFAIYLSPPGGLAKHLSRHPEHLMGGLDGEAVIVERDRLESLFGRDRITVRQGRGAEEATT